MAKNQLKDIDSIAQTCSDCGNCLAACPIYQVKLTEPSSPRGKVNLIKALQNGNLQKARENQRFVYQCLLCGSCQHICTKGVDFVPLMIEYRNHRSGGQQIPVLKKLMLFFYQSPLFKLLARVLKILARTPVKRIIPIEIGDYSNRFKKRSKGREHVDVLLFPGCVLATLMPQFLNKITETLQNQGFSCTIPDDFNCCGFPYISQGWRKKFTSLKDRNINIFKRYTFKYLVVPCGTGTMTFKEYYGLKDVEVFELSQFYYRFMKNLPVTVFPQEKNQRITFHHPCHNYKSLDIEEEPEFFLKKLNDRFVVDQEKLCCGFGGLFSATNVSLSKEILTKKQQQIQDMAVDVVVTSCPGCYMNLKGKVPQQVKFFPEIF